MSRANPKVFDLTIKDEDIRDYLHADTLTSIKIMRVMRKFDLAKTSQIQYWEEYGWIESTNAHIAEARRIFDQHNFRKIWFMGHLINNVGFHASKAAKLAEVVAKKSIEDTRPVIWIVYKGLTIGIPNVLKEAIDGNSGN